MRIIVTFCWLLMVISDFNIPRPMEDHWKQILYWSFNRILNCPLRSPDKDSKRFPGGMRNSSRVRTESSWSGFLYACFHNTEGQILAAVFVGFPLKISSVAWFLKECIMLTRLSCYSVPNYTKSWDSQTRNSPWGIAWRQNSLVDSVDISML